jgi:type IV pilus assembly protein PilM
MSDRRGRGAASRARGGDAGGKAATCGERSDRNFCTPLSETRGILTVEVWYPSCARMTGHTRRPPGAFMLAFGRNRSIVGLDVGSTAVKAIELKRAGTRYRVTAFGTASVPKGSIVDGAILDASAVTEAIREIFQNKAFTSKEVVASLSGNAVIVKKISLPAMTDDELAGSIGWEAEQHIPFDIQDVNLDYQIVDRTGQDGSKGAMEVLLVAAKKEKINGYTSAIAQAGRTPIVVDVDAFALQNAFEINYDPEPGAVVMLLNAGASAINVNIVCGAQSLFTRDISIAGNAYTEAVQRELNLSFEAAERAKTGAAVPGITFDDVRPVLRAITDNVLLEIQKTFDFFRATASSDRIDRIYLSGGTGAVDGLVEALEARFGAPVERLDPFRKVARPRKKTTRTGSDDPESLSAASAVAVGLALRKAGDR